MADWPYCTEQWQRLRKLKLSTDPLCEYCQPHRLTPAREVDHRTPITAGGEPWSLENLASACTRCHSQKTRADAQGIPWRRKGCGVDGKPLDQSHWWNT
jgi:5-methylcytosine-specific restriction enzyme A